MAAMSESFVDLTYRGLSLGRRVKLSEVRPTTGYVEMPASMPVGTQIGIITDDTVALDATVVEVHEQVSGSDRAPGMVVKPRLDGDASKSWWQKRVSLPEPEKKMTPVAMLAAVPPPSPVVVHGKRMTNPGMGVPEMAELFDQWHKSELNSFLIEITAQVLRKKDHDSAWILGR